MKELLHTLFSFILICLMLNVSRADTEVSCVVMETCTLPCSFQGQTDAVIHWIYTAGDLHVYSYYNNHDQLANQAPRFRGKASLFQDQISGGNASLQLTEVQVQDQGTYKCFTSTISGNKNSFINLKVNVPITKIHIEQVGNRMICSSEGIYPEPGLTWSTNPPSNTTFNSKTTVQQTEQLLYNISSSLILSDEDPDVDVSCTISTSRNSRTATLRKLVQISGSSSETIIPCSISNSPLIGLIWRFNHSHIILNQTNVTQTVSKKWKQHVKSVSDSGSLTLQNISLDQEGLYTCELRTADETHTTNTFLRLNKDQGNSTKVVIIVVVVLLIAAVTGLGLYIYKKVKTEQ